MKLITRKLLLDALFFSLLFIFIKFLTRVVYFILHVGLPFNFWLPEGFLLETLIVFATVFILRKKIEENLKKNLIKFSILVATFLAIIPFLSSLFILFAPNQFLVGEVKSEDLVIVEVVGQQKKQLITKNLRSILITYLVSAPLIIVTGHVFALKSKSSKASH